MAIKLHFRHIKFMYTRVELVPMSISAHEWSQLDPLTED